MENKKIFAVRYLIAIVVAQSAFALIALTGHFVFTAHWSQGAAAQSIITCLQLWMWLCWMRVSKNESLWMQESFAGGMILLFLVFCPASWLWFVLSHFTSVPVWAARLVSIGLAGVVGIGWFAFSTQCKKKSQMNVKEKKHDRS